MDALVSKPTIRALTDLFSSDWTLREIQNAFEDAGFVSGPVPEDQLESGQRRQLAQGYLTQINLNDPRHVQRLMPVFEDALGEDLATADGGVHTGKQRLLSRLERDGCRRDENGKLTLSSGLLLPSIAATDAITETVLREHLVRVERALHADTVDTAAIIGSSKELVESACKLVLEQLGEDESDINDWNMPTLTKATLKALKLHSDTLAPDGPMATTVRQILGSLSGIVVGVTELRNKKGTGHGHTRPDGLSPRHAHLAAGAAATFVRVLLETMDDPNAPWKQTPAS